MKVFILLRTYNYEGASVAGVYPTRELAEKAISSTDLWGADGLDVEEWPCDLPADEGFKGNG